MATIQVRHQRHCKRSWTTIDAEDCTCTKPMYYVVSRVDGAQIREVVGHNKQAAQRRLRKVQVAIDDDTYTALETRTFGEWADGWMKSLRARETTKATYASTIGYAKQVFGQKAIRKLTVTDISALLAHIEAAHEKRQKPDADGNVTPITETTLAKHVRQLGSCLEAARLAKLIPENPVRFLHDSAKPQAAKKNPSYFEDDELRLLWNAMTDLGVYSYLCRAAATTGMRSGELIALHWTDVNIGDSVISVSRTYTPGVGETPVKNKEPRIVNLTRQARQLLETWLVESGAVERGNELVFPRPEGDYLDAGKVLDILYASMETAGVPRKSERGGLRTFHSLRNTYARAVLEKGAPLQWAQAQLGHSSITLTADLYGTWSKAAAKEQAEKLADVFAV